MFAMIIGLIAIFILSGAWKTIFLSGVVFMSYGQEVDHNGQWKTPYKREMEKQVLKYQEKLFETEKSRTETKVSQAFINGGVHVWVPIMQKKLNVAYSKWKTFWQNQSVD